MLPVLPFMWSVKISMQPGWQPGWEAVGEAVVYVADNTYRQPLPVYAHGQNASKLV